MGVSVFSIQNEQLKVKIKRKGAEICSVIDQNGVEFIWQAEEVWQRHAPVLFPVVGSLLDHEFVLRWQDLSVETSRICT